MSFEPLNADHSIGSVQVTFVLDRSIDASDIDAFVERHDSVRDELPAISTSEDEFASIDLSYYRPDGSSAWSLRISNDEIVVECNRYTRWVKVWSQCERHLRFASETVNSVGSVSIKSVGLGVSDLFKTEFDELDIDQLFRPNEVFASNQFSGKTFWNCAYTWLENFQDRFELHRIEIERGLTETGPALLAWGRDATQISIVHRQRATPNSTIAIDNLGFSSASDIIQSLHRANKELLQRILTRDMLVKIGLGSAP